MLAGGIALLLSSPLPWGEGLGVSGSEVGDHSSDAGPPLPYPSPQGGGDVQPPVTSPETTPLPGRRRPGVPQRVLEPPVSQDNPGALRAPPPEAFPTDQIPIPDRWRLIESLGLVKERWFDPYNQNSYKADRPLCLPTDEEQAKRRAEGRPKCRTLRFLGLEGHDWFLNLSAVSDTVIEPRTFPIPVGVQTTERPGEIDVFGKNDSLA